jgi:PKD repeat protein
MGRALTGGYFARSGRLWWTCLALIALAAPAIEVMAEESPQQQIMTESPFGSPETGEYCYTQIYWDQKVANSTDKDVTACSTEGQCDNPFIRDGWIPDTTIPIIVIRLYFHILRNDDGSNAATTPSMVAAQVTHLNQDYLPYRIQFEYQWDYVNSSQYRFLDDNEMNGMKNAYAIAPDSQLNIFVSVVNQSYSYGTFPWDFASLTKTGGIVMTQGHFSSVQSVLAHEIGHCLGLWHTHHGVDEVTSCGACYEAPNGFESDLRGDFCSDTDPTPTNYSCSGPGGLDNCSGLFWGQTDPQNFMGYGPDFCIQEFSPQQAGRVHCWINDKLLGWVEGVKLEATNTFGPAPLDVDFVGVTGKTVNVWNWDLGDGTLADVQAPSHTYTTPGAFTVSVEIEATDGSYAAIRKDLVLAYADTIYTTSVTGSAGEQVVVDVYARNYIPVESMEIPISWGGDLNLTFTGVSTAGLRTESIAQQSFTHFNSGAKQATYFINPSVDLLNPVLAPGSGPVLRMFFTIGASQTSGSTPITIAPYDTHVPNWLSYQGMYEPVINVGTVEIDPCIAGDTNGDGNGPNLTDVTFLVNYLFQSGPPPPNMNSANVNGLDGINLTDLTVLVNYLFSGGPPPQCP